MESGPVKLNRKKFFSVRDVECCVDLLRVTDASPPEDYAFSSCVVTK